MKLTELLQIILFFVVGIAFTPVLGRYLARVFKGEKTFLHPLLFPVEKLVYRLSGVAPDEEMSWLKYMWSVVAMTCVGFASLIVILMTQKWLPLNTQGLDNLSWHLAFNTAWSFTCNADWQSYSGEAVMTYLSQTLGLSVHQFISGAAGLAILVWVAYGAAFPRQAWNAMARYALPLADIPPVGAAVLKVSPARDVTIGEGANLQVTVEVARKDSFNTILAGVMLDLVDEEPPPADPMEDEMTWEELFKAQDEARKAADAARDAWQAALVRHRRASRALEAASAEDEADRWTVYVPLASVTDVTVGKLMSAS